ncbi:MAG TPA: aldehyde dehydrogenase family protein [Streptosporangiaceae bacterium]|nr:aldehyde dehydrogenase family protein [Streptosporangiaceae bacterium]
MEATLHLALVDGERVGAVSGAALDVVNPATNQVIGQVPRCDERDVETAVIAAKRAAPGWRATEPQIRAAALLAFADTVAERGEELARLDSLDNGSPLHEMRNDIGLATSQVRYMAGLALEVRGRTMPETPGHLHYTMRQPFGVVARIIAFNHPLMFAATKIAAPLIVGNCVILKPSEFTSLSALAMAQDLARLFPPGVVQVLTGLGNEVGDALVRHPGIPRVAFIGSAATGRRIQASAAATAVKTVTLELGGKNPIVVFPDADLDLAVEGAVRGMNFTWQGQSCGSTSRLLIHRNCYDLVVQKVGERLAAMRPGSPLDPASDTGAIVTPQQLDKVLSYIEIGKSEQARLVTGGERLTAGDLAHGNFVTPALFADVDPAGRLATEEIFGPVLAAIAFGSYDEAVAIANRVEYGLTASVFTRDLRTALAFSRDVDAGYVWVNETSRHFLGAPFGGVKNSGVGREEDLEEIESYTQLKSVNIRF